MLGVTALTSNRYRRNLHYFWKWNIWAFQRHQDCQLDCQLVERSPPIASRWLTEWPDVHGQNGEDDPRMAVVPKNSVSVGFIWWVPIMDFWKLKVAHNTHVTCCIVYEWWGWHQAERHSCHINLDISAKCFDGQWRIWGGGRRVRQPPPLQTVGGSHQHGLYRRALTGRARSLCDRLSPRRSISVAFLKILDPPLLMTCRLYLVMFCSLLYHSTRVNLAMNVHQKCSYSEK